MGRRLSAVLAVTVVLVLGSGVAAWAHVTVQPGSAPRGSFSQLSFRVPNERESGDTVKIEVQLPADQPLAFVSVKPMQGWKITAKKTKLAKRIESDDGSVTEAVTEITWEGGVVEHGQYDDFSISAGPLPKTGDQMVFKAIQTYSNGDEVDWIEEATAGSAEPEHPAPVLKLTAGEGTEAAPSATTTKPASGGVTVAAVNQDDGDSANTKATVGIVVGVLGLLAGAGGLFLARRGAV